MTNSAMSNDIIEVIKLLIPVITFLAGFALSERRRLSESKAKIQSIKKILFKELAENYKHLNKAMPTDNFNLQKAEDINIIAKTAMAISERICCTVYTTYLDRIDVLNANDLEKIYDAYAMLEQFFLILKKYAASPSTMAPTVIEALQIAHNKCETALITFDEGEKFMNTQVVMRGEILQKIRAL